MEQSSNFRRPPNLLPSCCCQAKCQVSQPAHAFLAFLGSKECLKDGELLMMPCRGSFSCFTLHADEFELIYFLPGPASQPSPASLFPPLQLLRRGVNERSEESSELEEASCVSVKLCRHLPAPSSANQGSRSRRRTC